MIPTAIQVRQACALLGWKAPMLSRRAKISYKAAMNARRDDKISTLSDLELYAIHSALEAAGVEFIPENGGGAGMRLRKADG